MFLFFSCFDKRCCEVIPIQDEEIRNVIEIETIHYFMLTERITPPLALIEKCRRDKRILKIVCDYMKLIENYSDEKYTKVEAERIEKEMEKKLAPVFKNILNDITEKSLFKVVSSTRYVRFADKKDERQEEETKIKT